MALSKNATAVLDAIKESGNAGMTHFQLANLDVNYNTLRRITQELRSAGLVQTVNMPLGSLDRVKFIATVN